MKIKFEVSRTNRSKTTCPYGYIDGYEGSTKKVGSYAATTVCTSSLLTWRNEKWSADMMNDAEEIEYIQEMMLRHEDNAILLEQLQAMLNKATQRERKRQYATYFNNRK